MPDPVTSLTASPDPFEGWVVLAWTPPGTAYSGIVIEGRRTRDTAWTRYDQIPPSSSRKMLPSPYREYLYRVATVDGAGTLSSWDTLAVPTVLEGRLSVGYATWLVSCVDSSLKVALGATENMDSLAWQGQGSRVIVQPAGQPDAKIIFRRFHSKFAQQLQFVIPGAEYDGDTSTWIYGEDIKDLLERFEQESHLLHFRSLRIPEMYIFIWDVAPAPWAGSGVKVSFYGQRVTPPVPLLTLP